MAHSVTHWATTLAILQRLVIGYLDWQTMNYLAFCMMYFNLSSSLDLEILELLCCSSHAALALLSRGRILGQFAGEREESGSSGDVFPERFRNIETLCR